MIVHHLRAFILALRLTLQGRKIAPKHPELDVWARGAARHVEQVYQAAEAHGLDAAARAALILHLEHRDISMETILALVRHHVTQEYVKLQLDSVPHTFVAIYATNLNDRYRVARLRDAVDQRTVKAALQGLSDHLEKIPAQPDVKNL
jgi:hypothetical protein